MVNQSPMILGSPDAAALRKRMENLEKQMEALLDGMAALGQALEGLSDVVDAHDAEIKKVALSASVNETEILRQKDNLNA